MSFCKWGHAERRGRQVPTTVEGFKAAVRERGYDGLAEALISRSNRRLIRIERASPLMQDVCLPHLAVLPIFDAVVQELGGTPGRGPVHSGPKWIDHLAWGLDSAVAIVRMLLCLQPIGAAVIARTQLERWSSHIEFNSEIHQAAGEGTGAWLDRLWNDSGALVATESVPLGIGQLFDELSELLHGRGRFLPLIWLDVADISDYPSEMHVRLVNEITGALTLIVSHLRNGLASAAAAESRSRLASMIASIPSVGRCQAWMPDVKPYLYPMVPFFFNQDGVKVPLGVSAIGHRHVVEHLIAAGRSMSEPTEIWPVLAFGERRWRARVFAGFALNHERKVWPDDFDERGIERTVAESVLAGEMSGVLGLWLRSDPSLVSVADSLAACASALRSAVWLWLEDDERGMGCLRVAVEQLARARAWRIKPTAAVKFEASGKATPRDWMEAASWKRLTSLSRALGEFVHNTARTNPSVARAALVALQPDPDADRARHSGRTHALFVLIHLVQTESAHWTDKLDPELGNAYWKVVRFNSRQADQAMESLLQRAWISRSQPVR